MHTNLALFNSILYQLVIYIWEHIPEPLDTQSPLWKMESRLHWTHKEKTLGPTHKYFHTERGGNKGMPQNDITIQNSEYERENRNNHK